MATISIRVQAQGDPTLEELIQRALDLAEQAGLADVEYIDHGTPTTRSGARSVYVRVETTTPAEYDTTSDSIIRFDA